MPKNKIQPKNGCLVTKNSVQIIIVPAGKEEHYEAGYAQ
jgi:hypothetical protein